MKGKVNTKSQIKYENFKNELQNRIYEIFVPWKLHDEQSVIAGTLKGDIYRIS